MLTEFRITIEINVYKKHNPLAYPVLLHNPKDAIAQFNHPEFDIKATELMPIGTLAIVDRDYWEKEFNKMELVRWVN
jgi:hypothetical protein